MSSKHTLTAQNSSETSAELTALSARFVELFEADKNRLYAYIFAYVMDHAAADDIFQESSMVLWRDFEKFELGTNFSKWANGIAFNRVREYRSSHKKYTLGLTDDFLKEFSNEIAIAESEAETQAANKPAKWWHLQHCSSLLPSTLQQLYSTFYVDNLKAQDVANNTGRSVFAIRKSVHKLRKKLFDCVEHKLGEK